MVSQQYDDVLLHPWAENLALQNGQARFEPELLWYIIEALLLNQNSEIVVKFEGNCLIF